MQKVSIGRRIEIAKYQTKKKLKSYNKDQKIFMAVLGGTVASCYAYTAHRVNQ